MDDDDSRVWHIWDGFGQPHEALFSIQKPAALQPDSRVLIELQHVEFSEINLGRFRLSVTAPPPSSFRNSENPYVKNV